MSKISIAKVMGGYRIIEKVTPQGHWINLPMLYRSVESAQKDIDILLKDGYTNE